MARHQALFFNLLELHLKVALSCNPGQNGVYFQ